MRVLVGIGENADDRDVAAADLARDIAVEILGGDDRDRLGARGGHADAEHQQDQGKYAHRPPLDVTL